MSTKVVIKSGVSTAGIRPELLLAVTAARDIYASHNADLVITSVRDGTHSRGSLHYVGLAIDFRTRNLPGGAAVEVHAELRDALGAQFDVVLERDHIHVEFQPKIGG